MFFRRKPKPGPDNSAPVGAERRRSERISTAILNCDLGPVMDISAHGVRIGMSRMPPFVVGAEVVLGLQSPKDDLDVRATVIRIKAAGGGRYEVALNFLNWSESLGQSIVRLARTGSTRESQIADPVKREQLVAALKLPDYYALLKLSPSADAAQIQASFRQLARQYHPDVNKDPSAQSRFIQINEAHDVLTDIARRTEYDRLYVLRPVL
jgi:hypothetical protein